MSDRFKYHRPPNDRIVQLHEVVREQVAIAANAWEANLPECRERSLAITKLEEAMFWANAAIARNHGFYDEPS